MTIFEKNEQFWNFIGEKFVLPSLAPQIEKNEVQATAVNFLG